MRVTSQLTQPLLTKLPINSCGYALFLKWRIIHLVYALTAFLGIIIGVADYEYNYPEDRTPDLCSQNPRRTEVLRILMLVSSSTSVVFYAIQEWFKLKWKHKTGKRSRLSSHFIFVIVCLMLFPYPYLYGELCYLESYRFSRFTLCYTYSDFLFLVMLSRIFFLKGSLLNFTALRNYEARMRSRSFKTTAGYHFGLKVLVFERPSIGVILGLFFSVFLFIAIVVRVLERPAIQISELEFESVFNSLYFVVISMATVGYGDLTPVTTLGRALMMCTTFMGCCMFSVIIVSITKNNDLTYRERDLLKTIDLSEVAATSIQRAFRWYRQKKRGRYGGRPALELWLSVDEFRRKKTDIAGNNRSLETDVAEIKESLRKLMKVVEMISLDSDTVGENSQRSGSRSSLR